MAEWRKTERRGGGLVGRMDGVCYNKAAFLGGTREAGVSYPLLFTFYLLVGRVLYFSIYWA